MYEIEIKSRIDNPEIIEKKIISMGAKFEKVVKQEDFYFKHPCKDFKKSDEALRLRKEDEKIFLTYKGPKIDIETKTREEIEIFVDEDIIKILEKLGFEIAGKVIKTRKIFKMENIEISIDIVENLGTFVEIETFGEYQSSKEKILNLANLIGLSNLERRSYFELLGDENYG